MAVHNDVFISRFAEDLTVLQASTLIGGSSSDWANSIAIKNTGHVYVAAWTTSADYPVTPGVYDTTHNGSVDVAVSMLDVDLTALQASTFIGGSSNEEPYSLALDASGNVYITGYTTSADYSVTAGAYDISHNGNEDVFISKLDGNLTAAAPTGAVSPLQRLTTLIPYQRATSSLIPWLLSIAVLIQPWA